MKNHIVVRDKKISYTDIGKGKPVILVHGYLETAEVWTSFADKLAKKFRVIIPDLPGHGSSEIPEKTDSLESIASIINNLIDALDLGKVLLAGHSLGGYITLAFLELYPEKLNGYCLFHSHPLSDSPEAKEKRDMEISLVSEGNKDQFIPGNIIRLFATFNLEKIPETIEHSIKIASNITAEGIITVLKAMKIRPSRVHIMENGKVPGLWILGKYDNLIKFDTIQQNVKSPENLRIVVLEKTGHMGFIEEEENSFRILKDFVKNL
jgi:pimeloyl-ACP methyl ester carboxylesterase